jgi:hypothetical protein
MSTERETTVRTLKDEECGLVNGARRDLVTTLAVGEEDGGWGGWATTMAVGEEEPGCPHPVLLDSDLHNKI